MFVQVYAFMIWNSYTVRYFVFVSHSSSDFDLYVLWFKTFNHLLNSSFYKIMSILFWNDPPNLISRLILARKRSATTKKS